LVTLPNAERAFGGTCLLANHDSDDRRHWGQEEESFIRADERRRIARELHDSTSQLLVVLQLQLHRLTQIDDSETDSLLDECRQTISDIRQQIRALNLD